MGNPDIGVSRHGSQITAINYVQNKRGNMQKLEGGVGNFSKEQAIVE